MESPGVFSVKSLSRHLASASPLDPQLANCLRKSKRPRRVNITIYALLFGSLNFNSVMPKKLPTHYISLHIGPFCLRSHEDLQHIFFEYIYAAKCQSKLFLIFNISWSLDKVCKNNIRQLLTDRIMGKIASLIWCNAVKAILAEIWFKRNQRVFHNKSSSCQNRYELARLNASSWCSLSKQFNDYSLQDIVLNWQAFILPPP